MGIYRFLRPLKRKYLNKEINKIRAHRLQSKDHNKINLYAFTFQIKQEQTDCNLKTTKKSIQP